MIIMRIQGNNLTKQTKEQIIFFINTIEFKKRTNTKEKFKIFFGNVNFIKP